MPRNYKKRVGSRKYKDYSEETLQQCLTAVLNRDMTQRKAAETFNIPRRTIINHLRLLRLKMPSNPPGAPNTFTKEEEDVFVKCILKLSEYGFPLTTFDLRIVIKSYLEKIGRKVNKFKENCPGSEWVANFMKRNPILSQRFAANIKRNRAAVDKDTVTAYIEQLEQEVTGVPPENIWNYDETNLCDDPGQKKVITKRGMKYPELIRNSSKSSTSIMFAGNATGELLPPYTVYKAKQLWDTWTEHGPKNARYNNSPSGWFDMNIFNDWFFSLMLPRLKKQEGYKVIIGDNLSSHISVDVLKACDENHIKFICLPPNSTHLTQPLDVAFFRPMKVAWRQILSEWKASSQGRRETVIQKSSFPALLKKLLEVLAPTQAENLKSGFRKCGIVPIDASPLLERFPSAVNQGDLQDSFLETLEAKRLEWTNSTTKKRRTKLNIIPGKSVNVASLLNEENDELEQSSTSNLTATNLLNEENENQPSTSKLVRHRRRVSSESTYIESESSELESIGELENDSNYINVECPQKGFKPLVKKVGQYVVFTYEGELFPGVITKISNTGANISSMKKSLKFWKWPKPIDEIHYNWDEILGCISPPKKNSRREIYSVPELSHLWGL